MARISRRKFLAGSAAAAVSLGSRAGRAAYDEGASDTEIRIGNTSPYSGPVSQFGTLGTAMGSYFNTINQAGGINGRKIKFVSADDAYSPSKTAEQTRRLLESDQVLFFAGSVGTATQSAVQKYLNGKQVPQLFLLGGSSKWGNPAEFPWTIGWSPTYAAEAEVYAQHILANAKDAKIGVLFANDDFGRDYLAGLKRGLGPRASQIVMEAVVQATDATPDSAVLSMRASGAEVVLNAAPGKSASQAIRKMGEIGWKPLHFINNNSSTVEAFLKPAGLEYSTGLITAQYRKDTGDPLWASDKGMQDWKNWMKQANPGASLTDDLYAHGYCVAQTVVEVLTRAGNDLTRANIMKQATSLNNVSLPLLLPGVAINTSPTNFFPMRAMRLAKFTGERWDLFGDTITL